MSEKSQPAVVIVGGANYDFLACGKHLPAAGETVEGDLFDAAPGGKGANQAIGAARLGAEVAFVGCLGQDAQGDAVLAAFRRERVHAGHVLREPSAPTGVALIHVDERGQKQILAVGGANRRLTAEGVRAAKEAIAHARVLLLQLEVPLDAVCAAAEIAHEAGVQVVLDPAPAISLPDELLRLVDVVKPNANEAEILTGVPVDGRDSARRAAEKLLERGVGAVAVTAGSEGTLVVWRGGERWLPRLPVTSVDATGAGDAFAAGLGVALSEGSSVGDACAFANVAAALATTVVGAQAGLPSRKAVDALLAKT